MPTRRCCCFGCILGEDDFNRPDSIDLGPKWEILSGTAEILDNELVVDGIVATTFCHPAQFDLGSFVADFDLVDPTDGDIYVVTGGDPSAPTVTVTFTFTGTPGTGTVNVDINTGDEDEDWDFDWPSDTPLRASFCYSPDLDATINLSTPSIVLTPSVNACMGAGTTDNCWSATNTGAESVNVGNFAFNDGIYDNFYYEVHWIENKQCELCSCFCRLRDEDGVYDFSCVPKSMNVTLSGGEADCTGLAGTYVMNQKIRLDSPEDAPPSTLVYPQKVSWVTDPITCPHSVSTKIVLQLECIGTGKDDIDEVPQFQMTCVQWNTAAARGSNIGFDADDPDTTETADQSTDGNVSIGVCKSGTCTPISMTFPDLRENNYNSPLGNACCDGFLTSGGSYQPDYRWSVVVTE